MGVNVTFFLFVILGILFSYYLRYRFSGLDIKPWQFVVSMVSILCFLFNYSYFLDESCLMLIVCYPDIRDEYPDINWVVGVVIFLHCLGGPIRWRLRKGFEGQT